MTLTTVLADLRWARNTGIGAVQRSILSRAPAEIEILDLQLKGRIGSPWSPIAIAARLAKRAGESSVFWSPGYMPPIIARIPAVVTVHDLTHLRYYSRAHAQYYNFVLRSAFRRCRSIICVSEFTRNEFLNWSGMEDSRVVVVKNGVSPSFFRERPGESDQSPYILYPGNRRSYKNLARVIEAFSYSKLWKRGVRFAVTGSRGESVVRKAAEVGVEKYLVFLGDVSEEELAEIYNRALFVAFVSLYEGFGLPIVEAMAACVPVLTSNVSAMPEVAGDAALLVDPTSVEEIAGGMTRLAESSSLREELIQRGKSRIREFDWNMAAKQVWEVVSIAAK
jgi:glycosyltransferase involved in cell wall biosynthesis